LSDCSRGDRWSEHSLAGEPIPAREAYWTTLVEVAALWSASICCQRDTSRMILPSLFPASNRGVCRVHFLQPEHGLDGDANPPCRDQWQDLALDETRGNRLVLQRTSPQRGAANACPTIHELEQVNLAPCTGADADDDETASDRQ